MARYWTVRVGEEDAEKAAWSYDAPTPPFERLANHVAFYVAAMEECRVDGEVAQPQPGEFYGGWVTSDLAGLFKGVPGSWEVVIS